jgi:sn-glycerol 3-phosphate transport system ATP-binding protein
MAKINLQNIKKSYGNNTVIHNLSADIADGELIVIVGPSGCGKSTLLRMVAGLEEINSGEIIINDKKMNDLEPYGKKYCNGISKLCSLSAYDCF